MAKFVHDDVLDNGLAYLKSNGGRECLCSAQPTTYAPFQAHHRHVACDLDGFHGASLLDADSATHAGIGVVYRGESRVGDDVGVP